MTFEQWLKGEDGGSAACSRGLAWAKGKTLGITWTTCPRGDWLCWILDKAIYPNGGPPHWERHHWKLFLECLPNLSGLPLATLYLWYVGFDRDSRPSLEPHPSFGWMDWVWKQSASEIRRYYNGIEVCARIGQGII